MTAVGIPQGTTLDISREDDAEKTGFGKLSGVTTSACFSGKHCFDEVEGGLKAPFYGLIRISDHSLTGLIMQGAGVQVPA